MLSAFISASCLSAHEVVLADAMGIQLRFDLPALLVWQCNAVRDSARPAIASASTESVDANEDVLRSVSHVNFDPSCLVLPIRRHGAPIVSSLVSPLRPIGLFHSIVYSIPFHSSSRSIPCSLHLGSMNCA